MSNLQRARAAGNRDKQQTRATRTATAALRANNLVAAKLEDQKEFSQPAAQPDHLLTCQTPSDLPLTSQGVTRKAPPSSLRDSSGSPTSPLDSPSSGGDLVPGGAPVSWGALPFGMDAVVLPTISTDAAKTTLLTVDKADDPFDLPQDSVPSPSTVAINQADGNFPENIPANAPEDHSETAKASDIEEVTPGIAVQASRSSTPTSPVQPSSIKSFMAEFRAEFWKDRADAKARRRKEHQEDHEDSLTFCCEVNTRFKDRLARHVQEVKDRIHNSLVAISRQLGIQCRVS